MKNSDKQASPPRESRTLSRVALGALCLLVLVYFGLQLRDYLVDPFSTAAAAYTKVEETVSANGWLIRAEQVLPGEGSGLLRLTRQEGERVSQGGTVAKVYADQASLDRQTELDRLDERIEQLRYAAEESLSGVASLRLDSQIQDSLLSLRRAVEGGALAQAESEISQLRSLVLKRDYSRGDGTDAAAELAELQAQRKTLAAQGANSVRTLTAPKSGIYSAVVDGYETVLAPESLDTLTPSALSALTADSAVSSNVGKLITSDRWYYAAALPDDDAAGVEEGQSVTLRFAKGAAAALPAHQRTASGSIIHRQQRLDNIRAAACQHRAHGVHDGALGQVTYLRIEVRLSADKRRKDLAEIHINCLLSWDHAAKASPRRFCR